MSTRYSAVAIILHWCIAAGAFAMLISGLVIYQEWLSDAALFKWFQWHKSLGVILLLLIFSRILWRLLHSPPKLPSTFNALQRRASTFGHTFLYLLLILMPLSGWLVVSSSDLQVPTLVFNLFKWPHLPVPESLFKIIHSIASNLHFYGSLFLTALVIGHLAMVIKHHQQGINLLSRMPFTRLSQVTLCATIIIIFALSLSHNALSPLLTSSIKTSQTGAIQFKGIHAGKTFKGQFKNWTLKTNFDSKSRSLDSFELIVDTNSFETGNTFYDETLQEEDWFDPNNYPQIHFVASEVKKTHSTAMKISGILTVKRLQTPLEFTVQINDNNRLDTTFQLSRLQLGLGKISDPDAEWVDDNIQLTAWSQLN